MEPVGQLPFHISAVNLTASQVFALRHGDFIPNLLPAKSPGRPASLWLGSRVASTRFYAGWLGLFPRKMEFSIEIPHLSVSLLFPFFVLRLEAWRIPLCIIFKAVLSQTFFFSYVTFCIRCCNYATFPKKKYKSDIMYYTCCVFVFKKSGWVDDQNSSIYVIRRKKKTYYLLYFQLILSLKRWSCGYLPWVRLAGTNPLMKTVDPPHKMSSPA